MPTSRLSAYIAARGMKQTDFAAVIGVKAPTVNRYANGLRQPKRPIDRKISDVTFGVIHGGNCADPISDAEAADMMAEIARREAAAKAGEGSRG